MGLDYNFALRVGFSFKEKDFNKVFLKKEAGKYHLEKRFDPRTGNPISPEKVWDEHPSDHLEIAGERFESLMEFCYESNWVEKHLQCEIERSDTEKYGDYLVNFYIKPPYKQNNVSMGNISLQHGSISLEMFQQMLPQLTELKKKLEALGLSPGEPQIFVSYSVM